MESPTAVTETATRRQTKKEFEKRFWSHHHSLFGKTMENHKEKSAKNHIFGFGNQLLIRKVLPPYNTRPKMDTL